jgi:hypothetical protein
MINLGEKIVMISFQSHHHPDIEVVSLLPPKPPQPMAIALIAIRARLLHFRDRRNRLLTPVVEALSTDKS